MWVYVGSHSDWPFFVTVLSTSQAPVIELRPVRPLWLNFDQSGPCDWTSTSQAPVIELRLTWTKSYKHLFDVLGQLCWCCESMEQVVKVIWERLQANDPMHMVYTACAATWRTDWQTDTANIDKNGLHLMHSMQPKNVILNMRYVWLMSYMPCKFIRHGTGSAGRPTRWLGDNITDWTSKTLVECTTTAWDRKSWRQLVCHFTVSDLQQWRWNDDINVMLANSAAI